MATAIAGGDVITYTGAACVVVGLALVIAAALLVKIENLMIVKAIDGELDDIADLHGN